MSLISVYNKLQSIKEVSSTNAKIELLKHHLKGGNFLKTIQLMYDDNFHYNIKKLLPYVGPAKSRIPPQKIFGILKQLAEQRGTSKADKMYLAGFASADEQTYWVVQQIVKKTAQCGFAAKSINKAVPGTIFQMPYMRCSTESKLENIKYPAIAQEKADGSFANLIITETETLFRSRSGNDINQLEHLHSFIESKLTPNFLNTIYHGELLVRKNGVILDRPTGNGIINQCIQNTADPEDAKCVVLKLWDAVPAKDFWAHKSSLPYSKRLTKVDAFIRLMGNKKLIKRIRTKKIDSLSQARKFYAKMRSLGLEGAVVKNMDVIWQFHDSPNIIKLKNLSECDLRIVGWQYGEEGGANEHRMGSVLCSTDDLRVSASVGIGWKEKDREKNWDEEVGNIINVEFDSVTQDKRDKKDYSLYLPRNGGIREGDVHDTDTLETILKKVKG